MAPSPWLRALALVALTSVTACGTKAMPTPTVDAASIDDATSNDTSVGDDVTTDAPSSIPAYGPCATASDCRNLAAVCLTAMTDGYPGGMCTRNCTAQGQCGGDGVCLPFGSGHRCFPSCAHPTDCRSGYNCVLAANGTAQPVDACLPYCTADAQCGSVGCNVYSRFCGSVNTALGDDGAPCMQASDCKSGRCFTEIDSTGNPTGNLGGSCFSGCTIAPDSAYNGASVPQSDCPTGAVCPQDGTTPAGGTGLCWPECTAAADCRPGYICVHPSVPGSDGGTYANGYCAPMNCHYMTQTCPAGTSCETTVEDAGVALSGICVTGDGGTEGDATTDVSATTDIGMDGAGG